MPLDAEGKRLLSLSIDEREQIHQDANRINAERYAYRTANLKWRKQELRDAELQWIYIGCSGRCFLRTVSSCPSLRPGPSGCLPFQGFAVEHIAPKSLDANRDKVWDIRNMAIACTACNSRKGNRSFTASGGAAGADALSDVRPSIQLPDSAREQYRGATPTHGAAPASDDSSCWFLLCDCLCGVCDVLFGGDEEEEEEEEIK